jgi:hypothetical protein
MSRLERVPYNVSPETITTALNEVTGCESCQADADVPFKWVIDQAMQFSAVHIEYMLVEPVRCPFCGGRLAEDTLVRWE